jgi:3-dehydroquinate synthase
MTLRIASRIHDYELNFEPDSSFVAGLAAIPSAHYVVDQNVWRIHRAGALASLDPERTLIFEATESEKTFAGATRVFEAMLSGAAKRNATIVSIGGGIVQDVTGFAASTLYRGVRWIFVPTTLLAQADSCIGSKTSLNYGGFKNLLGTYYPPHQVHLCTAFLDSLVKADFFSGLGEVIKLHLMGGEEAISRLAASLPAIKDRRPEALLSVIRSSLEVKMSYFVGDEFDSGRRNLLNYGHCFGHALEATSDFAIPHGQAVLAGILFANRVASRRGILSPATVRRWEESLLLPNLLVRPQAAQLDVPALFEAMKKDKKRTGQGLPLIVMKDGGEMEKLDDLSLESLESGTRDLAEAIGV